MGKQGNNTGKIEFCWKLFRLMSCSKVSTKQRLLPPKPSLIYMRRTWYKLPA